VSEIKGVQALKETVSNGLDVTIVGDNDFYSQRAKESYLIPISILRTHLLFALNTARISEPTSDLVLPL
jgi:hypothetical protein